MEFTSSGPGSDRDIVYRSRAKLRGSGLFVSESLTPRRQAMFMDLLSLKKEGRIFSVFTRSGDILACKSRDSAPVRVADHEAVRRLAGSGAPRQPAQGRAQEAGRGVLLDSRAARDAPERGAMGADRCENMETEAAGHTDTAGSVRRVSPPEPREPREHRRQRAVDASELVDRSDRQRFGSSLLDCARESPVQLVHLSPPLLGVASAGGVAGPSVSDARDGSPSLDDASADSAAPLRRRAGTLPPESGAGLDPPMAVTSAAGSGRLAAVPVLRSGGREPSEVSSPTAVLPPRDQPENVEGLQSPEGGAVSTVAQRDRAEDGSPSHARRDMGLASVSVAVAPQEGTHADRVSNWSDGGRERRPRSFGSRDIREYF